MRKIRGLYQPTYTKARPDGTRETRKSEGWWLKYSTNGQRVRVNLADHAGGEPVRDRRVAERIAAKILAASEEKRAGLADPFEPHARRPIADHVADFKTTLHAKGVADQHERDCVRYVELGIAATGARSIADLDGTKVSEWLTKERERGLSARSINMRRGALRQFTRWLVRERRLAYDPLLSVGRLNQDADRRHVRRALTLSELARLLDAARRRPLEDARKERKVRGKLVRPEPKEKTVAELVGLGETRALVYAIAAGTGLRRGELGRLRWLDVDTLRGRVNVPASSAKSRRDQFVDLRSDLRAALEAHKPKGAAGADLVFPSQVFPNLRSFKLDLVAAGLAREDERGRIETRDEDGRAIDFHGLRTTLGSQLAAAGVPLVVAKAIMRHSTVELTAKHYVDVTALDTKGALERLALDAAPSGEARVRTQAS